MVIIEGPDGSGKTTLVSKLAWDLSLAIQPRATNSDADYTAPLDVWVEEHVSEKPSRRIYDRHQLISHLMYGPTMRRTLYGAFKNPEWLSTQLDMFWSWRPVVVICLPSIVEVKYNLSMDEHKVAEADIDVFYWNYHAWLSSHYTWAHVIHYDYEQDSYEDTRDLVDRHLKERGL